MSVRAILVVGLAGICGVSAVIGIKQLQNGSTTVVEAETTPIVLAAADVARGQMVTASDLRVGEWPKDMLPEGALVKVEDAVDRTAKVPLVAGEPMLEVKLAAKNAGRGLPPLIPLGMRAYTIPASSVTSNVGGFVLPGNRVDVLLNLKGSFNDETGGGSTTPLLQSVEILAVDQFLDAPADNKFDPQELRSVTLLVTADQATLLDLGQNMGKLTLSLRNPEDSQEANTRTATVNEIRYHQEGPVQEPKADAPAPPAPEKEKKSEILTIRGSQRGYYRYTGW